MNHLPTGLFITALAAAFVVATLPIAGGQAASSPVKFGMDAAAVSAQAAAGVPADYGTFWIGPWTLSSGWGGPDSQLTAMKSAGVTPAIHFYYWGDDISPSCVENGCWSSLHNAQKTRAGWNTLGTQLTDHLNSKMGGAPAVVFLESEFNKGGIETYEPFDGYMADMAAGIHDRYPNAIIVLGFGNWGSVYWKNYDRAAAESDMVGIQGMRGSTRQSQTDMYTLYDGLLAGVKTLGSTFPGKAIMLTDIAVSSYPEPGYLSVQDGVLKEVLDNLPTLKSLGVQALIYRSWKDSPNMDTANYYGEAERHWGLAWPDGTQKAAGKTWVAAVKAERAGSGTTGGTSSTTTTSTGTTSTSGAFTATVTPSLNSNEWWIQVGVSPAPAKVETKVADGAWTVMDAQSYGWTKSLHAPSGTPVQFRVTSSGGQQATTTAQAWLVDMSAKTATSAVSATVTPVGNEWWVQAGVTTSKAVTKVEAKAGSGSWTNLALQSYGWASSFNVPTGTLVQFRVTASDGQQATTTAQAWLVDMSAKTATFAAPSTTSTSTSATASATTTSTASTTTTSTSSTTTPSTSTSTSTSATSTSTPTSTTTTTSSTPTSTTTTTTTSTTSTSAAPAPLKATFSPKHRTNNAAVQVAVVADQPLAKVEASVGGGAYAPLAKLSNGMYAAAMPAPDGAKVTFRATSATGATATSAAYTWG